MDSILFFVLVLHCSSAAVYSGKRILMGSGGKYCAKSVLKKIPATSALRCARECSSESHCVSYSLQKGHQCLLHDDFCSMNDLIDAPGSVYAGEFLCYVMNE